MRPPRHRATSFRGFFFAGARQEGGREGDSNGTKIPPKVWGQEVEDGREDE